MSVGIQHEFPEGAYLIIERADGVMVRYIVLDTEEMKQLVSLIKGLGF